MYRVEWYMKYRVVYYRVLCYVKSVVLCTECYVMYRVAFYFIHKLNIRMEAGIIVQYYHFC